MLFVDPSFEESLVMNGCVTVVLDVNGNLVGTYNDGGYFVKPEKFMDFMGMAMDRVSVLSKMLQQVIKKHESEQLTLKIKVENDDAFLASAKNKGKNVSYSKRVHI